MKNFNSKLLNVAIESEDEHKIDPNTSLTINVENQDSLKGQLHKMNVNLLAYILKKNQMELRDIINSMGNLIRTCNLELDLTNSSRKMPIEVLH